MDRSVSVHKDWLKCSWPICYYLYRLYKGRTVGAKVGSLVSLLLWFLQIQFFWIFSFLSYWLYSYIYIACRIFLIFSSSTNFTSFCHSSFLFIESKAFSKSIKPTYNFPLFFLTSFSASPYDAKALSTVLKFFLNPARFGIRTFFAHLYSLSTTTFEKLFATVFRSVIPIYAPGPCLLSFLWRWCGSSPPPGQSAWFFVMLFFLAKFPGRKCFSRIWTDLLLTIAQLEPLWQLLIHPKYAGLCSGFS